MIKLSPLQNLCVLYEDLCKRVFEGVIKRKKQLESRMRAVLLPASKHFCRGLKLSRPAFTMVELLITISIIAFLSLSTALTSRAANNRAEMRGVASELVGMMQNARTLAVGGMQIEGEMLGDFEEISHYQLLGSSDAMLLYAESESIRELVDEMYLPENSHISWDAEGFELFYFAPEGNVCSDIDCANLDSGRLAVQISSSLSDLIIEIKVDEHGAFTEVNELQSL